MEFIITYSKKSLYYININNNNDLIIENFYGNGILKLYNVEKIIYHDHCLLINYKDNEYIFVSSGIFRFYSDNPIINLIVIEVQENKFSFAFTKTKIYFLDKKKSLFIEFLEDFEVEELYYLFEYLFHSFAKNFKHLKIN